MLDFVQNHTALDHPWVSSHSEHCVAGTAADLERAPHNDTRVANGQCDSVFTHGRDAYFFSLTSGSRRPVPDDTALSRSRPSREAASFFDIDAGQLLGSVVYQFGKEDAKIRPLMQGVLE
jgi:hypothetical protein